MVPRALMAGKVRPGGVRSSERPKARWNAEREGVARTLFQKKIAGVEKPESLLDPRGFLAELVRKRYPGKEPAQPGKEE